MPDRDRDRDKDRRRRRDKSKSESDSSSQSRDRDKRKKERNRDRDRRGKDKDRQRTKKSRSRSRKRKSRSKSRKKKSRSRRRTSDGLKKEDVGADKEKRKNNFDAPPPGSADFGGQLSAAGAAASAAVFGGIPSNTSLQDAFAQQAMLLAKAPPAMAPPAMDTVVLAAIARAKAAALATCSGDSAQAGAAVLPPSLVSPTLVSPRLGGPALGNAIAAAHAKAAAMRENRGLMQALPTPLSLQSRPPLPGHQVPGHHPGPPGAPLVAHNLQVPGAVAQFKRPPMPGGVSLGSMPGGFPQALQFGTAQPMGIPGAPPPLMVLSPLGSQPRSAFPPELVGNQDVEELTIGQASAKNPSVDLGYQSSFREVSPALADIINGNMA